MPQEKKLSPFLKWAGGKRWLAHLLVEKIGTIEGTYIEPFLGSGAVYFALTPQRAKLSDINTELINTYLALQDHHLEISKLLRSHQRKHCTSFYYWARDTYQPRSIASRAARFIYLNRTAWNGLYRVNKEGRFNVPKGTKNSVLLGTDNWPAIASLSRKAKFSCIDFETAIDGASCGDVIFSDPPYTVKHNLNGFIKYNELLFTWEDQKRLNAALIRAKHRGARIYSTNANHQSVREMYKKNFKLEALSRISVISGDAKYRGQFSELLICTN